MTQEIRFRNYRPDDYPEIESLWKQTKIFSYFDNKRIYDKKTSENPDLFIIAEINEKIVGTIFGFNPYSPFRLSCLKIGYIGHLAVHPDHQGQRMGSLLLEEICDRLIQREKKIVVLFVNFFGKRADDLIRFYRDKHRFNQLYFLFYKKLSNTALFSNPFLETVEENL